MQTPDELMDAFSQAGKVALRAYLTSKDINDYKELPKAKKIDYVKFYNQFHSFNPGGPYVLSAVRRRYCAIKRYAESRTENIFEWFELITSLKRCILNVLEEYTELGFF